MLEFSICKSISGVLIFLYSIIFIKKKNENKCLFSGHTRTNYQAYK